MSAALRCRLDEFDLSSVLENLGRLIAAAASQGFATHYSKQTEAWQQELEIFRQTSATLMTNLPVSRGWWICFEFDVPRRGKRPDVVLIADDLIFVIEFKIGSVAFDSGAVWQALSYALDIRDFHVGSEGRRIIPV